MHKEQPNVDLPFNAPAAPGDLERKNGRAPTEFAGDAVRDALAAGAGGRDTGFASTTSGGTETTDLGDRDKLATRCWYVIDMMSTKTRVWG
ncbi:MULTISPECIES: hypothetical protein [Actinomadura]|jgi:hypothetical protein|uniref:Uncharacterized protein n=1 Tax=Actinomadura geliboluensis TaxID=882440 RepID=A0A5S4GV05_9ACTN|nr:hypothetical protein [Actinomadura geliboluensis]TMR36785.1 hypothetical protein ETD96_19975 [Actinomadura geliboluensis]